MSEINRYSMWRHQGGAIVAFLRHEGAWLAYPSGLPLKSDMDQSAVDVRSVPFVDGSALARAFFT